ncbi:MAG: septum formation initiator family protein [Minisyncoccia bacterium]
MRNFQKKRVWRNIMQSRPVLVFLGVIILVFAWNVLGFWNTMEETGKNKQAVENKVLELKEQKEKLLADINSLQTEEGKEKFFRENYGLAKEGESVVIVVEDKNLPKEPTEDTSGFWSFLKNLFK